MANDIDLYDGGDIQPYNPGLPVLAPLSPSPDTWGNTTDLLREDHHQQPQGPTLFGAALPAGTTAQQMQAVLGEMGGIYLADFTKLGYPSALIQSAISFLMDNATKPARQVKRQHSFKLPSDLSGDWLAVLFANHLQGLAGTQAQKGQFLNASLQWLDRLNKRLNTQVGTPAQVSAPNSTEVLLAGLSDKDFDAVIKINELAQARTLQTLADKHGEHMARSMAELAQRQLKSLSPHERAHFEQFTTVDGQGWVSMLNTVTAVEYLYNAHIGAGSISASSADINKEIAQYEAMLKVPSERARYYKDSAMQARLRELYSRRGG